MMKRYGGKTALVTGGGSGLGEGFCRRLAREGARVAMLDVDAANGERVAAAIRAIGGDAGFFLADVTEADSMAAACVV